jgi:hypothetical protein
VSHTPSHTPKPLTCCPVRQQYPDVVGYTYFSYRFNARATNRGWRLDHFLVREGWAESWAWSGVQTHVVWQAGGSIRLLGC